MLVGMIYDRRHTRMIEEFGGLARVTPVYATFFMIVALVFETPPRYGAKHPHEAPKVMPLPLIVLGFFSVTAGFIGIPESFGLKNLFHHWLEPAFEDANAKLILESTHSTSTEFMLKSVCF